MIDEDVLEQLAIQWFQDTEWSCKHGSSIAPEGGAQERLDFGEVILKDRLAFATLSSPSFSPRSSLVSEAETQTDEALT